MTHSSEFIYRSAERCLRWILSALVAQARAARRSGERGTLVGMVFGTQALGLIVGPLIALALLGSGASDDVAWRVLLALGAVPAAAVIYLRCRMPESPRYQVQVQGRTDPAGRIPGFDGRPVSGGPGGPRHELGLRAFLTDRRWLIMLAGTAGCWFLLDYAYYGNTISTPQILGLISPHASTLTKVALQLAIFVVAAVPRLRAHPGPARTSRAQPGRHRHRYARPRRLAAAGGRSGLRDLTSTRLRPAASVGSRWNSASARVQVVRFGGGRAGYSSFRHFSFSQRSSSRPNAPHVCAARGIVSTTRCRKTVNITLNQTAARRRSRGGRVLFRSPRDRSLYAH
jgi:MFS family permease